MRLEPGHLGQQSRVLILPYGTHTCTHAHTHTHTHMHTHTHKHTHVHIHTHTHTHTLIAIEMGLFSRRQQFSPSSSSSSSFSLVTLCRKKIHALQLTRHMFRVYLAATLALVNGVKIYNCIVDRDIFTF